MKIVIAGGTGFVGKALIRRLLKDGHRVVALVRRPGVFKNLPDGNLIQAEWDGKQQGGWSSHLMDAEVVINLAGEGIADRRWDIERKRVIKASRLESTKALVNAISRSRSRPKTLVNVSAVGYYGPSPQGEVREDSPKGKGFLADVCADWEFEARKAGELGVRVVLPRLGIVLEKEGGALKKILTPFRFFMGGWLGSGRQPFPWVHREDVIGSILFMLENGAVSGPVNVVAPETLTMKQFCQALGRVLKSPCWAPVPSLALKMMLGEMSEMILAGQKAVPQKLLDSGYRFQHSRAEETLQAIFVTS